LVRRVDRYELLEEVGSGGMAVVYRGRDVALDREVAVKLLHPHLAARAESRARFAREARAVARLSHPNIVEIWDTAGEAALESYIVTEFVHGRTLRTFAEQIGIEYPEIAALLVRALADALVHAHAAGVIHRDLKPENVLVSERGRRALKLADFGIARILASDERMTMTGALVGSPNHMAPEIIEGEEADARSDIFSLGTILYWLATGKLPFSAPNPTATLRRVLEGDYPDPRQVSPLVSDELAAILAGTLAVKREDRIPTAAALRDRLDAVLEQAGLGEPDEELQAFLGDPAAYKEAFAGRLATALTTRGEGELDAGHTARALKLFNRVLAVDPHHPRVLSQLERMAKRARFRRTLRAASVALAVLAGAALGGAAWWRIANRPAPPPAPVAQVEPAPEVRAHDAPPARDVAVEDAPPASLPSPRPTAADTAPAGAGRGPAPASTPTASPSPGNPGAPGATTVAVLVRPYAQRALLDGVEVASGVQQVNFTLEPGRPHRIQIEHACCAPFVREFSATEKLPPTLELRVPLQPRPARLRVEALPQARVLVDGVFVGTAGESQRNPLEIPLPGTGPSPYEAQSEVRIEQAGRRPHVTTARFRAGADLTVVAPTADSARPDADAADASAGGSRDAGVSANERTP
jgi:serine/threonine-protein kinase